MSGPIRVLIVDDHAVVREGLRVFLDTQPDIEVVGEAADTDAAASEAARLRPDVVVSDLVMPGGGGIELIVRLKQTSPDARVLVLTSFLEDDKVLGAVRAGAAGYLLKNAAPREVAEAVRTAHRGEAVLDPGAAARLMATYADDTGSSTQQPAGPSALTPRELEVLRAIARGLSNREIARTLGVAEKTVKTHVSSVLSKLGVQDRTQAALYAVREGLAGD